jgi:hypothetical protein
MTDDMTIDLDGEEYVLRRSAGGLQVGRRVHGDVTWLDEVDGELLPPAARAALDRGDPADQTLATALRGIVRAEVERGG